MHCFFNILASLSHDHKNPLFDFRDTEKYFDNCRRFTYPGASNFLQALPSRSSSFFKVPNKHRRGWQVALRSQSLRKLSPFRHWSHWMPGLCWTKLTTCEASFWVGCTTIQELPLCNSFVSELINVAYFSAFRADRLNSKKVRRGGVVTYVHNEWGSTTKALFSFNANNIKALTVKCKSPCSTKFKHIIVTNVYIPPNISHSHITSFFDTLITSTCHLLSYNLYIVRGDFNRASTHSLSLLGLQHNKRLHSKVDHWFVNLKDIFKARKRAPLYLWL